MTRNRDEVAHDITEEATRAYPDKAVPEAVTAYLATHPQRYSDYLAAPPAPYEMTTNGGKTYEPVTWETVQATARRANPRLPPERALIRFFEAHPAVYAALVEQG